MILRRIETVVLRAELRSGCLDEVESAPTSSVPLSECLDPGQFPLAECDPSPLQLDAHLDGEEDPLRPFSIENAYRTSKNPVNSQ